MLRSRRFGIVLRLVWPGRGPSPDLMCDKCFAQPHSDELPLLKFHPWTPEKLHYLDRYASLLTQGMKNKWPERAYLDLFAGPGLGLLKSKLSKVIDGSPLAALKQPEPFTHYVFVDSDKSHISSLEKRAESLAPSSKKMFIYGNCNDSAVLAQIKQFVPTNALSLAFIDPFTWDIAFDTVCALTERRNVDIILICMVGPMKRAAQYSPASLDRFFGDDGEWNSLYMATRPRERTRVLLDHYANRLKTIGYLGEAYPFEVVVKNTKNVPLYYLVFASRNPRGQDFWKKTIQRTATGMRRMPGL